MLPFKVVEKGEVTWDLTVNSLFSLRDSYTCLRTLMFDKAWVGFCAAWYNRMWYSFPSSTI